MAGEGGDAGTAASWVDHGLLGRDALVGELASAAAQAANGSGSLVLLTGEAGIGKTSVARAVARLVGDGVRVSWGNCAVDRSAPPFWPWRSLIDIEAPSAVDGDPLDPAIGAPRFERLNDLRDRLVARRAPMLHVIEDLQWADVASVLLLGHVGATIVDLPIMILGTVRTGEPLPRPLDEAIGDVRRSAVVRAIPPLPDTAVELLIRGAGIEPDSELAATVRARTGGNPLFVTELLRAARTPEPGGRLRDIVAGSVPARVSELIGHRLTRLPDALSDLVITASVVGMEGDARTLATIRGSSVTSVVDLLEQARAAQLLEVVTPGRWRFRHDLVRDSVYASVTDADRARRHAAVLEALAADDATPPAVLARHALAAQPLFDAERAVALAARAGESAFAQQAYEEAVGWFEQALAATTPDVARRWRAELLVLRGEAHRHLGEIDVACRAFLEAANLAQDPALLARAALGYADPGADLGIAYRTDDPLTAELLERAIAAQPAEGSTTTVLLESRLAAELYFSDQPGRARTLVDAALDRARALDDRRALGAAGAVAHDAFVVGQAAMADQLRGSAQLLEWARETGSSAALLTAHRARVFDLLAAADLPAMDAEIVAFRRVAEPLKAAGYLWWPALWAAMRALLEGRHEAAEAHAFGAYEVGERPFPSLSFVNLSFLLFFLRREQGRFEEMEQATREYATSHADVPAIRVALTFLLAEIGRTDEARGLLSAISEHDLHRLRDRNWPASWFQLARAASLVGDRELSAILLEDRNRPTEPCVMVSLATVCLGSADLATAWLFHTVGALDAAEQHYVAAEAINARLGARSWLAHARADRARLLLDRGGADDRDAARRLVELASDAADEIGLRSLTPHLEPLRQQLAPPAATAPAGPAPVTATPTFRRAGSVWELDFAGRQAQIAHTRGMSDLAFLLARAGQAVSVLELSGDTPAASDTTRGAPALDERARREIRERLQDLDAEVAEAEANHDDERAAHARQQLEQLAESVARDFGLGGRARLIGDPIERARKTVSTRIRRTIGVVGRTHPELGRHLDRSIDTGTWCAYRPAEPVRWKT
jgi:tetratricopeptide (TPR) repeat protein